MLKLALEAGYSETGLLLMTLAIVALVFCGIIMAKRAWFRLTCRTIVFLLMLALLGYVLPLLAALWASPHVPAGLMTLIALFTPVVNIATALLCRTGGFLRNAFWPWPSALSPLSWFWCPKRVCPKPAISSGCFSSILCR